MPIQKTINLAGRDLAFHTVQGLTVRYKDGLPMLQARIFSWESAGAHSLGEDAYSWGTEPQHCEAEALGLEGFERSLMAYHPQFLGGEYVASGAPADALQVAKQRKASYLNQMRDAAIASFDHFTFDGVLFDGDPRAEKNIKRAADMARNGYPYPEGFTWRAFDNTEIPMTPAKLIALELAWTEAEGEHRLAHHMTCRQLKAAVELVTALEELEPIKWPTS